MWNPSLLFLLKLMRKDFGEASWNSSLPFLFKLMRKGFGEASCML